MRAYLRAIRISNLTQVEITDPLVFQRAGHIQIELEKYEDARVMLLMCAEKYKNAFSYFQLGVACYNLGNYDEAEKVLSMANYLNPKDPLPWSYLTLVLLKKDEPTIHAAYQTMNEAFKLGLTCNLTHQDLAYAWINIKQFKGAKEALEHACLVKIRSIKPAAAEKV